MEVAFFMSCDVRQVPVSKISRCPECGAFIALASFLIGIHCSACGFALAPVPRSAETRPLEARGVAGQSGSEGNAQQFKVRQLPNGKIVKTRKKTNENEQLDFFVGVVSVDGSGWLQQEAF